MVTSAQLRAARAYLDWTMEQAAAACGVHRRTIIRLEKDEGYAAGQPASLMKLIAIYRKQRIMFDFDPRPGMIRIAGSSIMQPTQTRAPTARGVHDATLRPVKQKRLRTVGVPN